MMGRRTAPRSSSHSPLDSTPRGGRLGWPGAQWRAGDEVEGEVGENQPNPQKICRRMLISQRGLACPTQDVLRLGAARLVPSDA